MPRLIPPELGNGKRPSDPAHSRGGPNDSVPILDVSEDAHALVGDAHDAALDPSDDTELLMGVVWFADNENPRDGSTPGPMRGGTSGATLHGAATEVIGAIAQLAGDMPRWVAASDDDLAAVVAEHYTVKGYSSCRVVSLNEASKEG